MFLISRSFVRSEYKIRILIISDSMLKEIDTWVANAQFNPYECGEEFIE